MSGESKVTRITVEAVKNVLNSDHVAEIVESLLERYDRHDVTRKEVIAHLSALQAVVKLEVDYPRDAVVVPNERIEIRLRSNRDIFGLYDGNDPINRWTKILDAVNKTKEEG